MVPFRRFLTACMALFGLTAALMTTIPAQAASAFSDAQKKQIEGIVHGYLVAHPEVIAQAAMVLQERQQKAHNAQAKAAVKRNSDIIFHTASDAVLGNPRGDVTMVEFFDYRCGYCKAVFPHLMDLINKDGNIRLVMKELPILGPNSVTAARWSVAAHRLGYYEPFHKTLMAHRGSINERVLRKVADDIGADGDALAREADRDEVGDLLSASLDLAHDLGIKGTPAFVIGDRVVPGALEADQLAALIDQQRAQIRKN